jgi:hypothetical protein
VLACWSAVVGLGWARSLAEARPSDRSKYKYKLCTSIEIVTLFPVVI